MGRKPLAAGVVSVAVFAATALALAAGRDRQASPAATQGGNPIAGKRVFVKAGCGACHTLNAAGTKGRVGPNLDVLKPTAAQVAAVVRSGRGPMPSFARKLTPKQIADLAAFVAKATGGNRRPTTGKGLFQRFCGSCHTLGAAGTRGTRGPNLDEEAPDFEEVVGVATEGEDGMPSFRSVLSRREIELIARYVATSAKGEGGEEEGGGDEGD